VTLIGLVRRQIAGSGFRNAVILVCVMLVAAVTLATTLTLMGSRQSLRLAMERLGADIVVVPQGAEARVETALLMGRPTTAWMPEGNLAAIAAVPGVATVSPQLYLSTLTGASCCSVSEMFLVAFDPRSDFTVRPWLTSRLGRELRLGEVVGGSHVFTPEGEQNIRVYGYIVTLVGNLEPTGTGLDQTMFLTFDTAADVARMSSSLAVKPLEIPQDNISAAMVRVAPGENPHDVAVRILQEVPGVTPIESPNLFQSYRQQLQGLMRGVVAVLAMVWLLGMVVVAMQLSVAVNERRREIGVLGALGATPAFILSSLLMEAGAVAMAGALAGLGTAALFTYLFHDLIVASLGLPFLLPSLGSLAVLVLVGAGLALLCVLLASLLPAIRISRQDPAISMRD
jgi:putative ABC transport system permease protein